MIWETETILTIATIITTLGGAVLVAIKLGARIREFWRKHKPDFWKYALVGVLAFAASWLSFIFIYSSEGSVPLAILVEATDGQIRPEMTAVEAGFAIKDLIESYQEQIAEFDKLKQDALSGKASDQGTRAVLVAHVEQLKKEAELWKRKAVHCKYTVYLETSEENQLLVDKVSFELAKNGFQVGGVDPEPSMENKVHYFGESDEARQVASDIQALIQALDDLAIQFPNPPDFFRDASRPDRDIVLQIRSNLHARSNP